MIDLEDATFLSFLYEGPEGLDTLSVFTLEVEHECFIEPELEGSGRPASNAAIDEVLSLLEVSAMKVLYALHQVDLVLSH